MAGASWGRTVLATSAMAASVAMLVSGCGGGGSSDAQQIRQLYPSMSSAMHQGNWSDVCSDVSYERQSQWVAQAQSAGIEATSCSQALTKTFAGSPGIVQSLAVDPDGLSFTLRSLAVHGNTATGRLEANGRFDGLVSFVREGGRWRLNTIGSFGDLLYNYTGTPQQESALGKVKANPNSAAAWSQLLRAQWQSVVEAGNLDRSTTTFTQLGKLELMAVTRDWQRYLQLSKSPDPDLAMTAARAYAFLGNYAGAASAWELETGTSPSQSGYECLAAAAFAAGQTRLGTLALNKALSLAPRSQQALINAEVTAAKSRPSLAQMC